MSTKANDVATPSQAGIAPAPAGGAAPAAGAVSKVAVGGGVASPGAGDGAGAKDGNIPANGGAGAKPAAPGVPDAGKPAADPAAPVDPKKDEPKAEAKAFAALTKREAAVRQKEEAFATTKREMEAKWAGFEKVHEAAKKDPIEAFRIIGRYESKEAAVKAFLKIAAGKPETAEERVARLERERDEEKKQAEADAEKRRNEERVSGIRAAEEKTHKEIESEIAGKPEDYELLAMEGKNGPLLVWKVMSAHFRQTLAAAQQEAARAGLDPSKATGIILSVKDATAMCEAGLVERARKYSGAKKLKAGEAAPAAPAPANPEPAKKAAPKAPAAGQAAPNSTAQDGAKAEDPPKFRTRNEEIEYYAKKYSRKAKPVNPATSS